MSDDDFSELSDVESDEYGATPSKKSSGTRKAKTSEFKVKNALRAPRPTTYTVQALYGTCEAVPLFTTALTCPSLDQIHGGDINLEPDYQRGELWAAACVATQPDAIHSRCRLARSKTNRNNRLYLSQLLHPASDFRCAAPLPLSGYRRSHWSCSCHHA